MRSIIRRWYISHVKDGKAVIEVVVSTEATSAKATQVEHTSYDASWRKLMASIGREQPVDAKELQLLINEIKSWKVTDDIQKVYRTPIWD